MCCGLWSSAQYNSFSLSTGASLPGHRLRRARPGRRQGQEKRWLIALPRLVFPLTLIDLNIALHIETDGGPKQGHGGRASHIGAVDQKIAAVAGALKAVLTGEPVGCTPEMRTDGN